MSFAGIVMGVGAQTDSGLDALKFATRDAKVLWAILSDANESLGRPSTDISLLLNEEVTRSRVLSEIGALVARSKDAPLDVVVIHFSGHGSHAGELLLFDTD